MTLTAENFLVSITHWAPQDRIYFVKLYMLVPHYILLYNDMYDVVAYFQCRKYNGKETERISVIIIIWHYTMRN